MDKNKEKEEIQYFANLVVTQTKEQLQKILNDFWLLDVNEYSIIKDLINDEIERLNKIVAEDKSDESVYSDDVIRQYFQDKHLRDFYIVMKEKVDYIISNGLCKQYK